MAAEELHARFHLQMLMPCRAYVCVRTRTHLTTHYTGHYRMVPDDWRHVSLSGQELVKEMLKLDATGENTTLHYERNFAMTLVCTFCANSHFVQTCSST